MPPNPLERPFLLVLAAACLLAAPLAAQAQEEPGDSPPLPAALSRDELRIGLNLGGTGFLGIVTEYRRNDWSAELYLGTITFREIGVSLSGKRYFSDGSLRPAVGAGLWSLTAWTEDGSGSILIARIPVAVDWRIQGGHFAGLEVGFNRALAVNRLDDEDDTAPRDRIIPIPGAYYRYAPER